MGDLVCRCGADVALFRRGHRHVCSACSSFWDAEHVGKATSYTGDYSRQRNHFDAALGALKRRSLDRWLCRMGLANGMAGQRVCEVGFGGGACLVALHQRYGGVYGIEANAANLDHVRRQGFPAGNLFAADELPECLPERVGLWLFQDSFEHLPDPAAFARWMNANSTADARVLLVAPLAGSLSDRLAGRWWPHRVPDHDFHWSVAGLKAFWRSHGFVVERRFFPWKDVSVDMLVRHLGVLTGRRLALPAAVGRCTLPFNIGEIGLLLRRVGDVE